MSLFDMSEKNGKEQGFYSVLPLSKISKLIEYVPIEVEPHKPTKIEILETLGFCCSYIISITRSSVEEGQIYHESFFFKLPEQNILI